MNLSGQVAAVTGGGRGLGRVFAEAFATAGARVVLLGRSQEDLEETAALVGRGAQAFCVDVTDAAAVAEVFREIGKVDLLVNNAGILGPLGPFVESDFNDWWRATEVNLRGAMLCTHAVLSGMIERRRGHIINLVTGAFSAAHLSAYLTSKTALVRATECLAAETKSQGIAFFSVAPGTVWTDMSKRSATSPEGLQWIPWFRRIFDEGLNLQPDRPAAMLVSLASGRYDALSGLHLTPFDDLDALLTDRAAIETAKLHTLQIRPRQVSPAAAAIATIRAAGGNAKS